MANYFDQFDAPAAQPKAKPAGNYFDRFDAKPAQPQAVQPSPIAKNELAMGEAHSDPALSTFAKAKLGAQAMIVPGAKRLLDDARDLLAGVPAGIAATEGAMVGEAYALFDPRAKKIAGKMPDIGSQALSNPFNVLMSKGSDVQDFGKLLGSLGDKADSVVLDWSKQVANKVDPKFIDNHPELVSLPAFVAKQLVLNSPALLDPALRLGGKAMTAGLDKALPLPRNVEVPGGARSGFGTANPPKPAMETQVSAGVQAGAKAIVAEAEKWANQEQKTAEPPKRVPPTVGDVAEPVPPKAPEAKPEYVPGAGDIGTARFDVALKAAGDVGRSMLAKIKQFNASMSVLSSQAKTVGDVQHTAWAAQSIKEAGMSGLSNYWHQTWLPLKEQFKISDEDIQALYHHDETRSEPLTPRQQMLYDELVAPLRDLHDELRKQRGKLTPEDWGEEGMTPRYAMGKRGPEEFAKSDSKWSGGSKVRTSTQGDKSRTVFKGRDVDTGEERIIHIGPSEAGGKRVLGFLEKGPTDLGEYKAVSPEEFVARMTRRDSQRLARLQREAAILERYQGKESRATQAMNRLRAKLADGEFSSVEQLGNYVRSLDEKRAQLMKQLAALDTVKEKPALERLAKQIEQLNGDREMADMLHGWFDDLPDGKSQFVAAADLVRKYGDRSAVQKAVDSTRKALGRLTERDRVLGLSEEERGQAVKDAAERKAMEQKLRTLEQVQEIYNPGQRRLANIKNKYIPEVRQRIADAQARYGKQPEGKYFSDGAGRLWEKKQATTREIEAATDIRYVKDPVLNYINRLQQEITAAAYSKLFEQLKDAKDVAGNNLFVPTEKLPVDTKMQQINSPWFRGLSADPKVAAIIEDITKVGGPHAAMKIANALISTMFLIPFRHMANVVGHYWLDKGLSGMVAALGKYSVGLPVYGPKFGLRLASALKHVMTESELYRQYKAQGAGFMHDRVMLRSMQEGIRQAYRDADPRFKSLGADAGLLPALAERIRTIGMGVKRGSDHVMWATDDTLKMMILEKKISSGIPAAEAIREMNKHIPDYRVPSNVLGSRTLGRLFNNVGVAQFGPYHYSILRSLVEANKDFLNGIYKRDAKLALHGLDLLMGMAFTATMIYPFLNYMIQRASGNKDARLAWVGPFKLPGEILNSFGFQGPLDQSWKYPKSPREIAQEFFMLHPLINTAQELYENRNLFTGQRLYDDHDAMSIAKAGVQEMVKMTMPVHLAAQVAEGKRTVGQVVGEQVGIMLPDKAQIEKQKKAYARERKAQAHIGKPKVKKEARE